MQYVNEPIGNETWEPASIYSPSTNTTTPQNAASVIFRTALIAAPLAAVEAVEIEPEEVADA